MLSGLRRQVVRSVRMLADAKEEPMRALLHVLIAVPLAILAFVLAFVALIVLLVLEGRRTAAARRRGVQYHVFAAPLSRPDARSV
jgi:hypothetical protein